MKQLRWLSMLTALLMLLAPACAALAEAAEVEEFAWDMSFLEDDALDFFRDMDIEELEQIEEMDLPILTVPEWGLTIPVVDNAVYFYRDMAADDPALVYFEMTAEEINSMLEANDCYLLAFAMNPSRTMTVKITENAPVDFSAFSAEEMEVFGTDLSSMYEGVERYEIIPAAETNYMIFWQKLDEETYNAQCYTMHKGLLLTISYESSVGPMDDNDAAVIYAILNGIVFE